MKKITLSFSCVLFATLSAFAQWTTSGSNIYNSNAGNVGIGTSSPAVKLEVNGGGSTDVVNVLNESNSLGLNALVSSSTDFHAPAFIGKRSRGTLASPSDVSSGDRVTGFYGTMYLNGAFRTSAAIQVYVGASPGSTSYPSNIRFETTASSSTTRTERMRITEAGDVGIGYSTPSYKLDVNGSARAVSFITSSDERLKTNIHKVENALDKLQNISGFSYNFDYLKFRDRQLPKDKRLGFIAQDIKKTFPELVSTDADGYLAVDYLSMVPVLVEAIKELKTEMDQVKEFYVTKLTEKEEENGVQFKNIKLANNPNPASSKSVFSYSVPDDLVGTATIMVYTFNGTPVKQVALEKRNGSVEITTDDLKNGVYLYSLIVNGKGVKTGRMIVTK